MQDKLRKTMGEIWRSIKENKKKVILAAIVVVALVAIITILLLNRQRSVTASAGNASGGENAVKNTEITTPKESDETSKAPQEDDSSKNNNEEDKEGDSRENNNETKTEQSDNNNNQVVGNVVTNPSGRLKVTGSKLTDAAGNVVQLRGISTHGIAWFPDYINAECFKELHNNFGINVIRLAMYTAEYNGYCTGGDKNYLKNLIDKGVRYATDNGMYVIIDWHILSDGNPNTYIGEAKQFFNEMASKYAANNNVIYEICNEPNGGTSWQDIKNYANEIIPVIRQYDKDAVILVGTPNWSQYVDQALADSITGYENIMYTFHFYAATHRDDMRQNVLNAVNAGLPVFVSEFGICDASGNGGIDEEQSGKWIKMLNDNQISYVIWNLSNKNETSSLISSACNKFSGFTVNDLSECGKWFLKLMTGQLSLPENAGNISSNNQQSQNQSGNNGQSQNNGNSNNNQSNNNQSNTNQSQGGNQTTYGMVNIGNSAKIVNSWQADGKTYYQYEITVTNNSGKTCGSWKTQITFSENVELKDKWNGNFEVNNNVITITSVDYNETLTNGESTGNIGIIVGGSSNLKIK